jgi:hypothetical protein
MGRFEHGGAIVLRGVWRDRPWVAMAAALVQDEPVGGPRKLGGARCADVPASRRANAYPPTAHWTSVLIEAMPETSEETTKGARWAPKLQMS